MAKQFMEGSEPFFLEGKNKKACLLLHGLTSSPFEVKYLGEKLNRAGYTAFAPRLPGHGSNIKDLDRTKWRDWFKVVEESFEFLDGQFKEVFVVGMSVGGTLALYLLSKETRAKGAAILAAPVLFGNIFVRYLLPVISYIPRLGLLPPVEKKGGPDIRDEGMKGRLVTYSHASIRAGAELMRLMSETRKNLHRIKTPIIVIQSENDHVVPKDNPEIILEAVSSEIKEMAWFVKSYHIITWDLEKDEVAKSVIDFFDGID